MEHKFVLTLDDQKYSMEGYRHPKRGDSFISKEGTLLADAFGLERLIVKPIRKEYVFGGIVFKETGEVRQVVSGDWYLYFVGPKAHVVNKPSETEPTVQRHTILRPVSLEDGGSDG